MENYISIIFWKKMTNDGFNGSNQEIFLDIMKDHIKFDQPNDWQELINIERQRICQAENTIEIDQQ